MLNFALSGLEAAINRYLNMDPDTINRLAKLEGKKIKIIIDDWRIEFFVLPNAQGLTLHQNINEEPDTTISGSLSTLFRVSCAKGETSELFKNKLSTSGDIETGEKIHDILSHIEIDWEEELSKLIGDFSANKMGELFRKVKDSALQTQNTLTTNLKEFLQFELKALPTREEVDNFMNEVGTLRNDVERAEARLKLLAARKASS